MKQNKQKTKVTIVVMVVLILAVAIGFWTMLKGKQAQNEGEKKQHTDEVAVLLDKDFSSNYPGTPTEVMKMYSRISTCLYSSSVSEEEQEALIKKMRELFDAQLLEENTFDDQWKDFQEEYEKFSKAKKMISSYSVDKNSSVDKKTIDDRRYAYLCVSYLVQDGSAGAYEKSNEQFVLREDADGKWKILGWELLTGDTE